MNINTIYISTKKQATELTVLICILCLNNLVPLRLFETLTDPPPYHDYSSVLNERTDWNKQIKANYLPV